MKTFRETVLMFIAFLTLSGIAYADDRDRNGGLAFEARLSSAQEVPENPSEARAKIEVEFDKGFTKLEIELKVRQTLWALSQGRTFTVPNPARMGPLFLGYLILDRFPCQ